MNNGTPEALTYCKKIYHSLKKEKAFDTQSIKGLLCILITLDARESKFAIQIRIRIVNVFRNIINSVQMNHKHNGSILEKFFNIRN